VATVAAEDAPGKRLDLVVVVALTDIQGIMLLQFLQHPCRQQEERHELLA
jgi:hypothetical protein